MSAAAQDPSRGCACFPGRVNHAASALFYLRPQYVDFQLKLMYSSLLRTIYLIFERICIAYPKFERKGRLRNRRLKQSTRLWTQRAAARRKPRATRLLHELGLGHLFFYIKKKKERERKASLSICTNPISACARAPRRSRAMHVCAKKEIFSAYLQHISYFLH